MAADWMAGRRTRPGLWLVVVATMATLAAACGKGGDSTSQPPTEDTIADEEGEATDGGSLIVGVAEETSGWNPTIDRWAQAGALVGSSVLEPLAMLDADGVAQPFLATEWEPSENYDAWTITLREGVTFHNGEAFDADAVKQNMDAAIN